MDLSTILRLVRYQAQKLEELLHVIKNGSTPKTWIKNPRNCNPFEIDVFAGGEQIKKVHVALEEMIEGRVKVLVQINALIQDLERALLRVRISGPLSIKIAVG